ncbi:MAG: hypothetical protein C4521_01595 [Actinobacteria bacterium]|nr:MAG: hypothetical protein C4521_01595 [Actinomycetota bacterium]
MFVRKRFTLLVALLLISSLAVPGELLAAPKMKSGPRARAQGAARPLGSIWGILLHSTQGFPKGDLSILSRSSKVSAHYLVMPNGTIHNLVSLRKTAYHAGRGRLAGRTGNLNRGLIGIEISNRSIPGRDVAYPEAQLEAVDWLIESIDGRMGKRLPIYGHKEVVRYPGGWRKSDPNGPFPLQQYKRNRKHTREPIYLQVGPYEKKNIRAFADRLAAAQKKAEVRQFKKSQSKVVRLRGGGHVYRVGPLSSKQALKEAARAAKLVPSGKVKILGGVEYPPSSAGPRPRGSYLQIGPYEKGNLDGVVDRMTAAQRRAKVTRFRKSQVKVVRLKKGGHVLRIGPIGRKGVRREALRAQSIVPSGKVRVLERGKALPYRPKAVRKKRPGSVLQVGPFEKKNLETFLERMTDAQRRAKVGRFQKEQVKIVPLRKGGHVLRVGPVSRKRVRHEAGRAQHFVPSGKVRVIEKGKALTYKVKVKYRKPADPRKESPAGSEKPSTGEARDAVKTDGKEQKRSASQTQRDGAARVREGDGERGRTGPPRVKRQTPERESFPPKDLNLKMLELLAKGYSLSGD